LLTIVALLLSLVVPALAQGDKFELETTAFQLLDRFDRPYVPEPNTVAIGVRLARDASVEALDAQGIEYRRDDANYMRYAVTDGVASLRFVIFRDHDRNPVPYEVVLLENQGGRWVKEPLRPGTWQAGSGSKRAVAHSLSRAPQQTWETLVVGGFFLAALLLVYILFGRVIFSRLLFGRRLEVSAAEWRSNVLMLVGVLLLVASCAGLVAYPQVLWGEPLAAYGVVSAVYLVVLLVAFAAAWMATRK
jgi:hypothetical protein